MQAIHKQWCQISWFGSKFYYLTIKVSYNRCKDINKFGNKYLPSAYKTQVDFRSHFSGKKVRLIVREIRYSLSYLYVPLGKWSATGGFLNSGWCRLLTMKKSGRRPSQEAEKSVPIWATSESCRWVSCPWTASRDVTPAANHVYKRYDAM